MKRQVFLQLITVASFSCSSLQDKEQLCTVTSTSIKELHSTGNVLRTCENLAGADNSRALIFKWVLFQHHPTLGTCISDTVQEWYEQCIHFEDIRTALQARTRSQDSIPMPVGPIPISVDSIPMHSVDFLFLIEKPTGAGTSNMESFLSTIKSALELAQDRNVFCDVRTQFGFIVYSLEDKLEYIYARDFTSDFPPDLLVHLLSVRSETTDSVAEPMQSSSYRNLEGAVAVMSKSLKLVSLKGKFHMQVRLANNKTSTLWHRPYSDLHILSVFDVGTNREVDEDDEIELAKSNTERSITKLFNKLTSTRVSPLTLHTFSRTSNRAVMSLLGDASVSVRYSDCSHFKKAATLKALISARKGDTLQALVLSKGVEFQVHSLQDLNSTRCIVNVSPALTTPQGVLPSLPDRCLVGGGNSDTKTMYCSSLHGWTKRDSRDLNSDLFQDTVPLTDKYSSSHADLARSVSQDVQVSQSTEELSITRPLGEGPKPVIVGQPRTIRWKHNAPFFKELLAGKQPVVLRGTVVETWPALKKWNMSYLMKNMDTDVLELVKCSNSFLTFDPDHHAPLKLNISLPYTLANLSTTSFFESVESSSTYSDGYSGHYYFGSVPRPLRSDIAPDTLLYNTEKDRKAGKQFMWISSAGMITHTHFDQDYNIFVQLFGRKRFTLWHPSQYELMYVYPRVHPMWHKSRVNYRGVDVVRFPAFTRARGEQVELGPGDVLYVPPYTWHYVETLSPSVSLSTWSHDYELYDHMNAIYRHDHKFDLLQNQRGMYVHMI